MQGHSGTTTARRDRARSDERLGPTAPLRPRRSIRPPQCPMEEAPVFVDRGRRWLVTLTAVVSCIAALALWWLMLVLAFTDGTSGSDPRLVDRGRVDQPAHDGLDAVGGPRR